MFVCIYRLLRTGRMWDDVNFLFNRFGFRVFLLLDHLTKAEEPNLPYYLTIAGGRLIESITFPRVLVLSEMHSSSSRTWTRVAVSISYDYNHYTTGTSKTQLFVDFSKAFDSIYRWKMEQIRLAYGFLKEIAPAIIMLYKNTKAMVRPPDGDTNFFNIVAEVLKGYSLARYRYIIWQDYVLCQ